MAGTEGGREGGREGAGCVAVCSKHRFSQLWMYIVLASLSVSTFLPLSWPEGVKAGGDT